MNKYAKKLVEILNARGINTCVVNDGHQTMVEAHLTWNGLPEEIRIPMVVTSFSFGPEDDSDSKRVVMVGAIGFVSCLTLDSHIKEIEIYKIANYFNSFRYDALEYTACVIPGDTGNALDVRREIEFSDENDMELVADELEKAEAAYYELFELACRYLAESNNRDGLKTAYIFLRASTGVEASKGDLFDAFTGIRKDKHYFSEIELKLFDQRYEF